MSTQHVVLTGLLAISILAPRSTSAQTSTAAATAQDLEAVYSVAIENRTAEIMKVLALDDPVKAAIIHDLIISQYRALRARDSGVDALLQTLSHAGPGVATNREVMRQALTRPLHDQFLARLGEQLTGEQLEKVKDKMTYNKVKFTYDAYGQIIPNLTDADKAKILELLRAAREEAIDGGSAGEKSDIFQKYKDQINVYLNAHGHDVARAYGDWHAKQAQAKAEASAPSATN
jgi:hypothetical protein